MKQKYLEMNHENCVRAVLDCFQGKWNRNDVLTVIEKYAGIPRSMIRAASKSGDITLKLEAAEAIAYEIDERIENYIHGEADDLLLEAVKTEERIDGMNGKVREIASCDILQQVIGHYLQISMDGLFRAHIKPNQFASIPGKGQVRLMKKIQKILRSRGNFVRYCKKLDIRKAYPSTSYDVAVWYVRKCIPNAEWILKTLECLGKHAPGGHLIIGGYIDAWLFNFLISFAVDELNAMYKERRGVKERLVKAQVSYMDDMSLFGTSLSDLRKAEKKLRKFLNSEMGLELKDAVKETRILTIKEEKDLLSSGGRVRPPGVDMGGFVVHRSYTSIRAGVFLRARRCYMRAYREIKRCGRIPVDRAHRVCAYYGYFKHTGMSKICRELHVREVMAMAASAIAADERRKQCLAKM